MEIGWIDFSKEERNKVLSVIDLLSEPGAVDELGIGIIRDGFSNIFFPSISTIQTRAKYFLIVPYILAELERTKGMTQNAMLERLDSRERECAEKLLENNVEGVIGSRALKSNKWVKRKPSDTYWNGLRTFGIFTGGKMSLADYARLTSYISSQKQAVKVQGNIRFTGDENDADDANAALGIYPVNFWKLPGIISKDWLDTLTIDLAFDEAEFLKTQIIENCGSSLLGFILSENRYDFLELDHFDDIAGTILPILPEQIKSDYMMAKAFSDFINGAHIRYNILLSKGNHDGIQEEWAKFNSKMAEFASMDLDKIFARLKIANYNLIRFLRSCKDAMQKNDIERLDSLVLKREIELKGKNRSKLANADEFNFQSWVGISKLQYLLPNARRIAGDIFKGAGDLDA
jgi:hypothetical protein